MRDILETIRAEREPGGILAEMPEEDNLMLGEVLQLSPSKMDRLDAIYSAFLFAYIVGVKAGRRAA